MSGWTLGYVVANQVAVAVVRNLAEPGSGDASAYFEAFTFFVLPHGLLAVSIATTFTPELASAVGRTDRAGFIDQASLGVRLVALLTMPAACAVRRSADRSSVHCCSTATSTRPTPPTPPRALGGFALGLVGFSVYLFVLRGLLRAPGHPHAIHHQPGQNGSTSCSPSCSSAAMAILGLGAGASPSPTSCARLWALPGVVVQGAGFPAREVLVRGWPMLVAAVLDGEAAWVVNRWIGGNTGTEAVVGVIVGGIVGLAVYVGALMAHARAGDRRGASHGRSADPKGPPLGPRAGVIALHFVHVLCRQEVVEVPHRKAVG